MKKYLSTILTLLLLIFLISCGGGGGGGGGSSSTQGKLSFVQIKLGGSEKPDVNSNGETTGFRENVIPSNIYKFSFTISASDMTTVQKDVLVSGQTAVTETFSIQNGSSRYFLIEAKDSSGSVLYKGDSTKDLDGTPVTLDIVMVAQNTTGGGTTTTTDTTTTTTTTSTTTTTTTTSDTTAPTITAVSPADSATGVSITSTITATFSESMDSSTITTSTFTVSGGVSGTVSYSGTTATFTPSSSLSYSTTYTATITTGVKDSAGNTMASNYTWSWTTASAPGSNNANLSSLTVSGGVLNPSFSSGTTSYSAMFITQTSVTVTPTAADSGASITVNGTSVASGQASGSISLSDGANTITIVVTAADTVTTKTYTITANKLYQQAYAKASNTGAGDLFGYYSVAISGDTLVVGAQHEDSNATGINGNQADNSAADSGAVYVFTRSGTTWSQEAYIKASNTEASDNFGISVAISGDTLAVGADWEDSNATGINGNQADNSASASGAVYVFTRSGTTWSQQAYIKASNTEASDNFGYRVAISGDTLAVGAIYEDSNATGINGNQADNSAADSGAVYKFTRSGTTWSQNAYIKASNTGYGDWFGSSVAISGDTLVVGALAEDSNATGINGNQSDNSASNSGAVYVFTRSGTTWSQEAYVKASNTGAGDWFGYRVAISGDTLAVGAIYEDSNATGINGNQADNGAADSGAVYKFTRSGTTWSQDAYVKSSNTEADDYFGSSVSISGDTLAVGAHLEDSIATGINGNQADNSAGSSGAVYVFK